MPSRLSVSSSLLPFRALVALLAVSSLTAQNAPPPPSAVNAPPTAPAGSTETLALDPFVVTSKLDETRDTLQPSLGATSFQMDQQQLLNLPQGADTPFNQVLLRAPGVAEDSAANGDLHVRGEHGNL
jgi:hypothetical protein